MIVKKHKQEQKVKLYTENSKNLIISENHLDQFIMPREGRSFFRKIIDVFKSNTAALEELTRL